MSAAGESLFLNDLSLSHQEAWQLIERGAADRHSPLHTLAVATVTSEGTASQRIMVLRASDRANRQLRFNTDLRASKVSDIGHDSSISVLGYHPQAKVQLRLTGKAVVQTAGDDVETAWAQASLYGQRCYLADPAPGSVVDAPTSGLDPAVQGVKPSPEQVRPARGNFAILLVEVELVEWLYLAHSGHRRARFEWNWAASRWDGSWLVP